MEKLVYNLDMEYINDNWWWDVFIQYLMSFGS